MVKRKGGFWDYVETENDCLKCVFCGFGGPISISKFIDHLSGVGMCGKVPHNVKAAAYEASQSVNKRLKTIPSSSNEKENGDIESMKSNIEKLNNEAEKLMNGWSSLHRLVEEATKNGEKIEDSVENWLTKADKAIQDTNELTRQGEEIEANGLCPNLKSRCQQLSMKAKSLASAIGVLQNERNFARISYPVPLKEILSSAVDGYQALDSRELKLKEVMDALRDPNVNMIGLLGMGGIGKTTLAKEIAKRSREEKLYDVVITVTVSEKPEIKEIQGKIADILRCTFNQETQSGRASLLQHWLTEEVKKRNILIILDDLWAKLKLEEVGIPFGNDSKRCKILLTSRNQNVLSDEMGTQKVFSLEELPEGEALRLFEETVGDPKLPDEATEIVKKCAGLPILIVTVAVSLKNKPIQVWRHTLKQLSRFDNEGIQAKAHYILKLSYDRLKGGAQPLFLLCGLLGNSDILIHDLLTYGMGLGLFKGMSTVEEARNEVITLILQLKASCLLQNGDRNGFVRMHDVFREVAVSIASDDQHAVTSRHVAGSQRWPKDRLKNATRISLPYCNIPDIHDGMECPEVELFLLFVKDRLLKVPDQLFKGFEKLKVLSFAGMRFPSLPPSLGGLTNLQTLCLKDCMLSDVAIVGALKKLEILSFRDSNIVQLPREIEQLIGLKLLDLRNCSGLKVIPAKVISKLTLLEELYIVNSFNRWEVEGLRHASLAELKHLSHLSALEIHVPDAKMLPKDFFFKELKSYKISIESRWNFGDSYETSRGLELGSSICLGNGVKWLLKGTETLSLSNIEGIKNILNDLDSNGFQQLKQLEVYKCCDVQFLTTSCVSSIAFPKLEFLSLSCLKTLEKFCDGQLIEGLFSALRSLKVSECHKLKNLFTLSMVPGLSQLRELHIVLCNEMEVIVADDVNDKNKVVEFPQLVSLKLKGLYQLRSFFLEGSGPSTAQLLSWPLFSKKVSFPSMEKLIIKYISCKSIWDEDHFSQISPNITSINVDGCRNLKQLMAKCYDDVQFLTSSSLPSSASPKLEFLSLRSLESPEKFCQRPLIEGLFSAVRTLKVAKCHKLKNLFTLSMVPGLSQLRELDIDNCKEMEVIVADDINDKNKVVGFPQLLSLTLWRLDQLRSFFLEASGPSATQLLSLPLFNEKVEFPNLREMNIFGCAKIEIVFSSNVSRRFYKLERLDVYHCSSVETIYQLTTGLYVEKTLFSLKELRLIYLPKLKYIWSKDPQEKHGEVQVQQQKNWVEEVFPNLELLCLGMEATMIILQCGFSTRFFSKLKFVNFGRFEDEPPVALLRFLGKLHNLGTLSVCDSHFKELFSFVCEANEEDAWKLPQTRTLLLYSLGNLEHIWMQAHDYSQLGSIAQYLEHLKVDACKALINLAPSFVSFENLTTLSVQSCGGLLTLVTSSVAKSMVQLTTMDIRECQSLTEIISNGMTEEEEIIFYKLKTLKLSSLKKLTCFWAGSCNMKFPSLEEVTLKSCHNLRIFSHGDVITPKLVNVHSHVRHWDGDLNSTVQHLYTEVESEADETSSSTETDADENYSSRETEADENSSSTDCDLEELNAIEEYTG